MVQQFIPADRQKATLFAAKRWQATIGPPEIQKFAGALHGHRAKKVVFITTPISPAKLEIRAQNRIKDCAD